MSQKCKTLTLFYFHSLTVISTFIEPIPAWSNSYGGMNGVTVGIGSGLLRNLFWKNIELNIVCADFVTNGSLAIASHTASQYSRTIFEAKIYHINRVSDKALFFGKFAFCMYSAGHYECQRYFPIHKADGEWNGVHLVACMEYCLRDRANGEGGGRKSENGFSYNFVKLLSEPNLLIRSLYQDHFAFTLQLKHISILLNVFGVLCLCVFVLFLVFLVENNCSCCCIALVCAQCKK